MRSLQMRIGTASILFIVISISNYSRAAEDFLVFRSKDMGIKEFDLTATEVKREPRKSILEVPGFNHRSAAGSR